MSDPWCSGDKGSRCSNNPTQTSMGPKPQANATPNENWPTNQSSLNETFWYSTYQYWI